MVLSPVTDYSPIDYVLHENSKPCCSPTRVENYVIINVIDNFIILNFFQLFTIPRLSVIVLLISLKYV